MNRIGRQPKDQEVIPISRLSEYLRAVGTLHGIESISFKDLLLSLNDITKRELQEDLLKLGFDSDTDLPRTSFARALRGHLKSIRTKSTLHDFGTSVLPTVDEFLNSLQMQEGTISGERASVIEAAYSYAEIATELFLSGHGVFRTKMEDQASEPIIAYKHQIEEARKIVEQFSGNAIAVHEVGLGKTITAILVLCELLVRKPDLTTLILVPTNLKNQWIQEITRCAELPIYTGSSPEQIASNPIVLISIDTAKEARWARLLVSRDWDFLIVDEGHLLRHDQTSRYRFVYSLHARRRLLLTATPVHNSPYDIYHQVNIVRPGYLGKKDVFAESHMIGERQLMKPDVLQERLQQVVSHQTRKNTGLSFPQRVIVDVQITERSELERQLYNDVLKILRGIYRRHIGTITYLRRPSGKEQGVSQLVLVAILILRELASHPLAALKTLSGPLQKQVTRFAELSSDTTDLEALRRIIDTYADQPWQQGSHAKTDELIQQLPELVKAYGRIIVYVEFRETQKVIIERLQRRREIGLPPKTDIISFHGGLTIKEKKHQIERFEQHAQAIFVSTDAGGQGLNLQKGNVVVNFDFPWNPMRVEQRIGRVDRLEQAADQVFVKNFITVDTIEQYVYQTLRQKLRVCEDVLGHVLPLIFRLRLREVHYFSEADVLGIGQIILSSKDDKDLRQKFLKFGQSLEEEIATKRKMWRPERKWIDE